MSLFDTGIRPAVDAYLDKKSKEERDYGEYWSASSAGYCTRKVIFDRLKVPKVKDDARKTRVFESGHIFHKWIQRTTKEAGLSIAQETELQDEELMIRGHIDDLVLVNAEVTKNMWSVTGDGDFKEERVTSYTTTEKHLILYDYKTQNSRAFSFQKDRPMSFYHKMQLGTYMYMLRKMKELNIEWPLGMPENIMEMINHLSESRILKISKDDLRMSEQQLMWSPELEREVAQYWITLNGYWENKLLPVCTCADHEGGFLAKEAYNDYFFDSEPCSLTWLKQRAKEGRVNTKDWKMEK